MADLLFVLPLRYEDRTRVSMIGSLVAGSRAAVEGEIQLTEVAYRGRRQLLCRISDGSGIADPALLLFFRPASSTAWRAARGCAASARCAAVRSGLEIVHPEYRRLTQEAAPLEETLTPIYPLTEGVPQGRLRALVAEALRELERAPLRDFIPGEAPLPARLPPLDAALEYLHRPPREAQLAELPRGPASGAAAARLRGAAGASPRAQAAPAHPQGRSRLRPHRRGAARAALPRRAAVPPHPRAGPCAARADADLAADTPMARLVQGDVGCGKTVVAAAAAARAAGSGLQAALMAPTELLAEQHWRNLRDWFQPLT